MARKGSKKPKEAAAPKDHNLKKLEPHFKDLMKAFAAMEADSGSHRSNIKNLYDKAASETGFTKKTIRTELGKIRRRQKEINDELEMADNERTETEELRDALKDTPFGRFLGGKLATRMA